MRPALCDLRRAATTEDDDLNLMARELAIEVTVEGQQAEAALGRLEVGLQRVEVAAGQLHGPLTKLDTLAADQAKQFDEMRASLNRTDEALKKKTATVTDKTIPAMSELTNLVRQYAGPAVIGLAIKQTLAFADHVENLSKQTGIAPDKLQALSFSAKQVGLSLDPVAKSIGMMSDRLASGDKSAIAGLERLGLSFKTIRSLSPDAAFIEIARAVAQVEDPMERARDATDLFGRTGIELLPLLTADIDELMKKAKELGLVMDDKTTKAATDLNQQFSNLLDVGKRVIMVFFAPLIPILSTILGLLTPVTAALGQMINAILSPLDQMREFAELLGVIATRMPGAPKGPGMTFDPGQLPMMGIPDGADLAGIYGSGRAPRRSNVLPFQQPDGYQPMDSGYAAWLQQSRGPQGSFGVAPFPGWATPTPFSGQMEGGLPFGSYAGNTATMNPPGAAPSMWSRLSGNKFLGTGLGMLSGLIPGMSGKGASIGSMMGSFIPGLGPLGGMLGGLVGGGLGKLFGGGEAGKTRDARKSFIGDFGGMGALQSAADTAGFSLDKLLNAKKMSDFTAEVDKLKDAMGAYDQKIKDANAELDSMNAQLEDAVKQGEQLGYSFDKSGNLVSVNFKKMQEIAEKYGISLDALGPAFQKQRLHDSAMEIVNDFNLLNMGGTDTGTILLGMSDKINKLVNDSIKFGVDIPANMKPYIQNLIDAGELVDANGNKITDMSKIKFGDTMATEFEKIQGSIKELIEKMSVLIDKIATMGSTVDNATRNRTINIGVNVNDPDGLLSGGDGNSYAMSRGGFVPYPRYLAGGGFLPRGTDTVPAMLTPGEGVMRREAVSRLMRGDWPQGGSGLQLIVENVTVDSGARNEADFEARIGKAVVTGLKRKGVRLNAA